MGPPPDRTPMPALVRPMLATAGTLPPAGRDEGWAFEMKWDGVRAVCYVEGATVRVRSRNDRDVSATYPETAGLAGGLRGRAAVLDGELVAMSAAGRPDFGLLQRRMHVQHPTPALLAAVPVTYLAFDLLWLNGRDLLGTPYAVRRGLLEELDLSAERWDTPPVFVSGGEQALAASRAAGLEGVVAKRVDSRYEPGRRSPAWLKIKHQRMQTVVVGGWKPGAGRRSGGIGSLLLGVPGPAGLAFVGHVGTGFTEAALADLAGRLRPLVRDTAAFTGDIPAQYARDAVWVTPRLVGEVVFTEWTHDGRLRHPSWRGLRPDTDPDDVVLEP